MTATTLPARHRTGSRDRVVVDPDAPYLRLDGERWFPSGWCCARANALTVDDLDAMAAAGCNTLRLWPDPNETAVLPQSLPDLLRRAEEVGIRCSLTLLNLGELSDVFIDVPNLKRIRNAYRSFCETPQELLISPQARALSRRRIDDFLDVVGESPAVYEWVVCNQLDAIYQVPIAVLDEFTAEMCGYLAGEEERRFGGRRLQTVTSFDPLPVWRGVYDSPHLDVVGLHCYSPAVYAPVDALQAAWEVATTTVAACSWRAPGRPVHCLEYGSILHHFLPEHPPLPRDLIARWRRNTAAAHLCAGGAGGPLLVPSAAADAPTPEGAAAEGATDLVRPVPRTIPPEFEAEERHFRRLVADPALQTTTGSPTPVGAPAGALAVASGSAHGSLVVWVAADTRVAERQALVRRACEGDPGVSPLLGYDAGQAVLEDAGARAWNPGSRALVGKLLAKDLADVAEERARLELDKVRRLIEQLDPPAAAETLAGTHLELPRSGRTRSYRCYDLATGEVVAEGTARGTVALPELSETVVALEAR